MKKRVVKFGGSNLKSPGDMANLVKVVSHYEEPIVIVVSALYGITDILEQALHVVREEEQAIDHLKQGLISAHQEILGLYGGNGGRGRFGQRFRQRLRQLR